MAEEVGFEPTSGFLHRDSLASYWNAIIRLLLFIYFTILLHFSQSIRLRFELEVSV